MAKMVAIMTVFLVFSCSGPLFGQQGREPSPTANPLYAGSARCGGCHWGEYNYWKITPHASMARVPEWEGSETLKQLTSEGLPFPQEAVDLVIGNLKVLVFLTRKGQDLVALPKQYNLYLKRWEDFTEEEWEPRLGGADKRLEGEPVNWNERCAGCHTTGYQPVTRTFVELSIGCEECHGPGARHAQTTKKDDIVNPRSLPREEAISVCGQCHSRGVSKDGRRPFPTAFVPGDLLSDHFDVLRPKPGTNTEAYWGNGMARRHHQQYQEFAQSAHYLIGLSCLDCHEGHRFKLKSAPKGPRALWAQTEMAFLAHGAHSVCLRCHTEAEKEFMEVVIPLEGSKAPQIKNIELHSRHPLVLEKRLKVGSAPIRAKLLCNDCHMPMTAPAEFGYPMHTHTFRTPNPKATLRYGVPNACNQCHSDKTPTWAREQYLVMWVLKEGAPDELVKFMLEFEDAESAYLQLRAFMSDAEPSQRARLDAVGSLYQRILHFVAPLRERSAAYVDNAALKKVLDELQAMEPMLSGLDSLINTWEADTKAALRALLDTDALAALNHVLRARMLPEVSPPPIAASYGKTVEAFLAFNRAVDQKGQSFFEKAGRRTSWRTWVKIYKALSDGTYRENPEHDISELEQMRLIKKRLTLE
jgi:hypothetical protein